MKRSERREPYIPILRLPGNIEALLGEVQRRAFVETGHPSFRALPPLLVWRHIEYTEHTRIVDVPGSISISGIDLRSHGDHGLLVVPVRGEIGDRDDGGDIPADMVRRAGGSVFLGALSRPLSREFRNDLAEGVREFSFRKLRLSRLYMTGNSWNKISWHIDAGPWLRFHGPAPML